jgi:hypothetical protein
MQGQDAASHWIVEFDHAPGSADLAAIAAAGNEVTGPLPDNAVVVSGPTSNLAHIAGMRWASYGDLRQNQHGTGLGTPFAQCSGGIS